VGRGPPPRPSGRPADRRPRKGRIRQNGRVAFDYEGREVGFGQGLDRDEAAAVVKELLTRFRHLQPAGQGA
jgi:hypothetical protein